LGRKDEARTRLAEEATMKEAQQSILDVQIGISDYISNFMATACTTLYTIMLNIALIVIQCLRRFTMEKS